MNKPHVLHVLVVGFHHKKGCQIEFCYPAANEHNWLEETEWKSIPALALPDGSHNFNEDVVYFNLPRNRKYSKSIFGISCFKQINVDKLKNRTDDLTRPSVQKSVCILCTKPLFGKIKVHIASVTRAYFDRGDFTLTAILKEAYDNLNYCLASSNEDLTRSAYLGLSALNLFLDWQQKTLLLFKMLLLEKKVMFYYSPVKPLCSIILTLISLFPELLENGLENCNHFVRSEPETAASSEPDVHYSNSTCTLFHDEYLFFPYLSLSFLDHLEESRSTGFVMGTTNVLFKHKKQQLVDVVVDIETLKIDFCRTSSESDLKKQLTLTVQDLRFCDYLAGHFRVMVAAETAAAAGILPSMSATASVQDQRLDETWLREQFHCYLVNMLKVAIEKSSFEEDKFNSAFLDAWRRTNNFQRWKSFFSSSNFFLNLEAEHPAAKNLSNSSISDVKLKFNNFIQTNENCRKINEAVVNTNRAINSAKDSLSNWWTNRKSHQHLQSEL